MHPKVLFVPLDAKVVWPTSNLPYQNPLSSLFPKVKASIAVSFCFTNVTSIAPGLSAVPPL